MNKTSGINEFYKITKERPASVLLKRAIIYCKKKNKALDLGCGALRDTRYLLEEGFRVTAVDKNTEVLEMAKEVSNPNNLSVIISSFEDFSFLPEEYDLINAHWSLPFNPPETFNVVFSKMKQALKPQGVFVGQLFGANDEWNVGVSNKTFHTKEQVHKLLSDMEVVELEEVDEDSTLADGTPKHWHVFHIIARNVE